MHALDEDDDPPPADDEEFIRFREGQDRASTGMAAVFLRVYNQGAMDDGIEPHGPPDPVDGAAVAAEAVLEIENHRAACRRAAELIAEDSGARHRAGRTGPAQLGDILHAVLCAQGVLRSPAPSAAWPRTAVYPWPMGRQYRPAPVYSQGQSTKESRRTVEASPGQDSPQETHDTTSEVSA